MKIKVSEASGLALDWMVATCEGYTNLRVGKHGVVLFMDPPRVAYGAIDFSDLNYSYDWALAGPIIEWERITLDGNAILNQWMAVAYVPNEEPWEMRGPTPLVAAMRCYVASKLGDEVEVPDQLITS